MVQSERISRIAEKFNIPGTVQGVVAVVKIGWHRHDLDSIDESICVRAISAWGEVKVQPLAVLDHHAELP